jgi:Uri superfamily endonuclease
MHGMIQQNASRLGADNAGPKRPRAKRLRWHVDYLLDAREVSLERIIALRSQRRLELEMASCIDGLAAVSPLAPGLGAGDAPGGTHLWWTVSLDGVWPHLETSAVTLVHRQRRDEDSCAANG